MDPHAVNLTSYDKLKKKKKSPGKNSKTSDDSALQGDDSSDVANTEEVVQERRSSVLEAIEEILNPSIRIPETIGDYVAPEAVHEGDVNALNDLDERKLIELKEVFIMFDTDADGIISAEDLKATFFAVGKEMPDSLIEQMLKEAHQPVTFESFVMLMGYKTIELDPEDVLLEAWSKWDKHGNGTIEEETIFYDLISYGNPLTKEEASDALEEAPLAKPKSLDEPAMIDYQAFCRMLCGLRKRK